MDRQTGRATVEQSRLVVPAARPAVALSSLAVVKRTETVAKGALASDDPFRVGDARIVPWVTEAELDAGRTLRLFFVAYVPPGAPTPQVTLEFERDGQVVSRVAPALPAPDAQGRIPYVSACPRPALRPGRYEVRAELRSGRDRAWERCSFRLRRARSPPRPPRAPRLERVPGRTLP